MQCIFNSCFKSGCSLSLAATPVFAPVITDAPSEENALKYFTSNPNLEMRSSKQSCIVFSSAELVSEKPNKSSESMNAVSASPFSSSQYLMNVNRFCILEISVTSSVSIPKKESFLSSPADLI